MTAALSRAPRPPRDQGLFTSTELFGEPGIYPGGPALKLADGPDLDEHGARALLRGIDTGGDRSGGDTFDDPSLRRIAPTPVVRAALASLVGTVARPALDALLAGADPEGFELSPTSGPGRVVGPTASDPARRSVNDRYRAERPELIAPSLAHALVWSGPGAGQCEEVALHALAAMVHAQLIAQQPMLTRTGTELARRQNSLLISLLNSRNAGSATVSLVAPSGPGTIPGGAPGMQTRDFASIPFASSEDPRRRCPPAFLEIVGMDPTSSASYEPAVFDLLDRVFADGWLSPRDRVVVEIALGLMTDVDIDRIAEHAHSDRAAIVTELDLGPALASWD